MAIASKGKGKSGGARVITYTVIADINEGEVYLLSIYDKSDYDSVDVRTLERIVRELGLQDHSL